MRFLLKSGDLVRASRGLSRAPRPGDLVVRVLWDGGSPAYAVHRFLGAARWGGKDFAITKGDGNILPDRPCPLRELAGIVEGHRFRGRWRVPAGRPGWRDLALAASTPLMVVFAIPAWAAVFASARVREPGEGASEPAARAWQAAAERVGTGWAARLQAAVSRFSRWEDSGPSDASPRAFFGVLDGEQEWSGEVHVEGDIYIPPGATLRLAPGTRVHFHEPSRWDCSDEARRAAFLGGGRSGALCRVIVGGRLLVEGTPEAPVLLGKGRWGGIILGPAARGCRFRHAEIARVEGAGIAVLSSPDPRLADVSISDCRHGLVLDGIGANISMRSSRIFRCREAPVLVRAGAGARIADSELADGESGLVCEGPTAPVRVRNVRLLRQRRSGLRAQSRARVCARGLRVAETPVGAEVFGRRRPPALGRLASWLGDTRVRLEGSLLSPGEGGVGARVEGGSLEIKRSVLRGGRRGLEVRRGDIRLERTRLEGSEEGAILEASTASLLSSEWTGCRRGMSAADSRLILRDARLDACARGLDLRGGRLEARGLSVSGGERGLRAGPGARVLARECAFCGQSVHAVEVAGGSFRAEAASFDDIPGTAVRLEAGRLDLRDSVFRRVGCAAAGEGGESYFERVKIFAARRLAASFEGGRHRLRGLALRACADGVRAGPGAEVSQERPRRAGASGRVREALQAAVLSTADWPGLSAAYRAAYRLAPRLISAWASGIPGLEMAAVHRSFARGAWLPGASDIDLLFSMEGLSGESGAARAEAFYAGLGRLKAAIPFLGESLLGETADWALFRARSRRGRALEKGAVVLRGSLPAAAAPEGSGPELPEDVERLLEGAHAYTRLLVWTTRRGALGRVRRVRLEKAARDVWAVLGREPEEMERRLLGAASLAAEDASGACIRAQLCARALKRMHEEAQGALSRWPAGSGFPSQAGMAPGPAAAGELAMMRGRRDAARRALGPALVAGCCDDLYRSHFILDDAAAGGAEEAFLGLQGLSASPEAFPTQGIVLTETLWRAWSRLPYIEAPTRFLEPGSGGGEALISAGARFPGAHLYAWGRERLGGGPQTPSRSLVLLAAAQLAAGWRFEAAGAADLGADYRAHYLMTRVMCLRLLLGPGEAAASFDSDVLRRRYASAFPGPGRRLEEILARAPEEDGPPGWRALYAWAAAETRAMA